MVEQITFCGATVRDIRSRLGWNGQKSSLDVALVEDPALEQDFLPPLPRTPVYMDIPESSFKFYGIMQSYQETGNLGGKPTFNVKCEDPRDILEACTVILSGYNGTTSYVPNLMNVYGYWEATLGYGGAQVNESGMPWHLIKEGIRVMTHNLLGTPFGGPLNYDGYLYAVDLTQLPVPPSYYRIGGTEASLLSLISQICEDGVCDFFVELLPTEPILTIKVRTASRRFQPPLGSIYNLIQQESTSGITESTSRGLEARHDVTSSFCIGGPVQSMYEAIEDGIGEPIAHQFFSFDSVGRPIIGTGSGYSMSFTANSQEVADIVGGIGYTCTIAELCAVLTGNNISTWMIYMKENRPTDYAFMGLDSEYSYAQAFLGGNVPKNANDIKDFTAAQLSAAASALTETLRAQKQVRMHNFLRKLATEFMGRQFLLRIPFVFVKQIPESNQVVFSEEPVDSGFSNSGVAPLGLDFLLEGQFRSEDGKYYAYVKFNNVAQMDLSRIADQGNNFIFGSTGVYMKVQVDPKIIFLDAITPTVKITLPAQIWSAPIDVTGGGWENVLTFLHGNQMTEAHLKAVILNRAGGALPGGAYLQPLPLQPTGFAIPFKSNVLSYGPWYAVGAPGKVQVTVDSSLTPWNYGNFALMNEAGTAKVVNALAAQVYTESGGFTKVGLPDYNLGDTLQANGPNFTDIDIAFGLDKITTTYRLQTFTQRIGLFNKDFDRRLQRLARNNMQIRTNLRETLTKAIQLRNAAGASMGAKLDYNFMQNQKAALRGESPHGLIVARVHDGRISMQTFETNSSYLGAAVGYPDNYINSAGMSFDGLLRPVETNLSATNGIPKIGFVGTNPFSTAVVTVDDLNPYMPGNDIELMVRGSGSGSQSDLHNYWLENGNTTAVTGGTRPLALRGPLVVCGWGHDLFTGSNVPSTPLRNYSNWKAAPVDLLYDSMRGVWTMHDLVLGIVTTAVSGNTGVISIGIDNGTSIVYPTGNNLSVRNFFNGTIATGTKVQAGYFMHTGHWYIIAADCPE